MLLQVFRRLVRYTLSIESHHRRNSSAHRGSRPRIPEPIASGVAAADAEAAAAAVVADVADEEEYVDCRADDFSTESRTVGSVASLDGAVAS